MADETTISSPFEGVTFGSILRNAGKRLKSVGEAIPREIAAGYGDLMESARGTPFNPLPTAMLTDYLRDRERGKRREQFGDQPTIGPTGFAQHSSDPAVQIGAMALDPANLIGAGVGGAVVKGAKKLGAAAEAAQKAATETLKKRGLINLKLREMPPEQAAATAQAEEHLFPIVGGGFIGGPRNVKTRDQLTRNRRRMDRELEGAADAIENAGETVGDWYPSQQRGVAAIAEPWQQKRTAQETALMSSQTDPEGERGFMIQAHNRMARGEPVGVAHTGRQGREFEASAREGRDIKLGEKTGNYAILSDPTQPNTPFGTNDFRQAQFHGYTEPTGKPQTTGLKPTQHAFLDAETLLLEQRARAKALGGRTDWNGPMVQEVPWIVEKANSYQKRFPKRFPKTSEGRDAAIREASKTGEDFNLKHGVSATYSRIPGRDLGHDEAVMDLSMADQKAYSERAPWMTPEGRDVIYQGQGLLQLPTKRGVGIYEGVTEPNFIALPLGDIESKIRGTKKALPAGRELAPGMKEQLALGENLRGLVDVQRHVAAHLPMTQSARKAGTKTNVLLEHADQLDESEMKALSQQLPKDWNAAPSGRGTMLIAPDGGTSKQATKLAQSLDTPISQALRKQPATVQRAGMEGIYEPVYVDAKGDPLPQGEGLATSAFLRRAAASPEASVRGMSESDAIRAAIKEVMKRDVERAAQGATIREDVQKSRRFLSEADWAKAVDLVKKGKTPAAAVAALGYSLSGMADEEVPR